VSPKIEDRIIAILITVAVGMIAYGLWLGHSVGMAP
jgi:hypothetical protein